MLENFSTQRFLQVIIVFLFVLFLNSNVSAQKSGALFLKVNQDHSTWSADDALMYRGRRKSRSLELISIDFSGGLLFDINEFYENQSAEFKNDSSKNNYTGTNYLSVGLNSENENRIIGLAAEIFYFKVEPTPRTNISQAGYIEFYPEMNREKVQSQLIFHYGKSLIQTTKYKLHWGPIASLIYSFEKHIPLSSKYYQISVADYGIGLGLKIQNQFQVTDKFGLTLGSRFFILDSLLRHERTANPTLPLRTQRQSGFTLQLLRQELLVQLGVNFKI